MSSVESLPRVIGSFTRFSMALRSFGSGVTVKFPSIRSFLIFCALSSVLRKSSRRALT